MVAVPRWLSVCGHRVPRVGYPYFLVLQHDIVPSQTRIVAPVVPAGSRLPSVLVPHIVVEGVVYRVMLLEMTAVPLAVLGTVIGTSDVPEQAIANGLDAIFRGYPVGLPLT